jgi:dTDP-4-dehydrorhamnose reductase
MSTKVVVLGGTGMLGAMVTDWFARTAALDTTATARTPELLERARTALPQVRWAALDAQTAADEALAALVDGHAWVVNAIGITKPLIHDDDPAEVERAVVVNSLFPHRLARATAAAGARLLQIATDCVYSGARGAYVEGDAHDALDVYGKTKSIGEVWAPNAHHLRCSIIGPEPKERKFLLEWFLGQPRGAEVQGFVNHSWNGVTTLHFARLCEGIVQAAPALPHLQHVVPANAETKADLLSLFAATYERGDVCIRRGEATSHVDRTLATSDAERNRELWRLAGYAEPPTIAAMVSELGAYTPALRAL